MPEIQWREPELFAAGDTLKFKRYLPDYLPGSGWSLLYVLRSATGELAAQFTSTASGNDHEISEDDFCATQEAGDYVLVGYAVKDAERHQIYYAELTLSADAASGGVPEQNKTFVQKALEGVEAQILKLTEHTLQESDVQRSKFLWAKRAELMEQRARLREERFAELRAEAIRNGQPDRNSIVPVFKIA